MVPINTTWLSTFNGRLNRYLQASQEELGCSGGKGKKEFLSITRIALVAIDQLQEGRGLVRLGTDAFPNRAYFWISPGQMSLLFHRNTLSSERSSIAKKVVEEISTTLPLPVVRSRFTGKLRVPLMRFEDVVSVTWKERLGTELLIAQGVSDLVTEPSVGSVDENEAQISVLGVNYTFTGKPGYKEALDVFLTAVASKAQVVFDEFIAQIRYFRTAGERRVTIVDDHNFVYSLLARYAAPGEISMRQSPARVGLLIPEVTDFNCRLRSPDFRAAVEANLHLQLIGFVREMVNKEPSGARTCYLFDLIRKIDEVVQQQTSARSALAPVAVTNFYD